MVRYRMAPRSTIAALLLAACGGVPTSTAGAHTDASVGPDSSADADGSGGSGGIAGGGGTLGAAGTGGASATGGAAGVAGGAGSGAAGHAGAGGADAGPPPLESCATPGSCGPDAYCWFETAACVDPHPYGSYCLARPATCDAVYAPVCGCDGKLYANVCLAEQAGYFVGDVCDASLTPPGRFDCGGRYCDPKTSYCWNEIGHESNTFQCAPYPEAA